MFNQAMKKLFPAFFLLMIPANPILSQCIPDSVEIIDRASPELVDTCRGMVERINSIFH